MMNPVNEEKPEPDPNKIGGRRRRGSRRTRRGSRKGPRKHRKGSKKRTAGKWIGHVKQFAKDNKMSFKDAMSSAECKAGYKRMK